MGTYSSNIGRVNTEGVVCARNEGAVREVDLDRVRRVARDGGSAKDEGAKRSKGRREHVRFSGGRDLGC
jgi:hypothetical protein